MSENKFETEHQKVADFYDHVYHRNDGFSDAGRSHLLGLAKKIGVTPGQTILDVACGKGIGWR